MAQRKEIAQHKCEFCGVDNYESIMGKRRTFQVVLTCAHLDHDETNHNVSIDRLRMLCQPCHLKYDAPEKARRRKEKKFLNQLNLF